MTDTTPVAVLEDGAYASGWSVESDHLQASAYADGVVLVTLANPERRNACLLYTSPSPRD